jgi:hypothetical protein
MGNDNEKNSKNENITTKGFENISKFLNINQKYKELDNIKKYFNSIHLENIFFLENVTYLKTTFINTNDHEKIPKKLFLNTIKTLLNINDNNIKEKILKIFNDEYFLNEGNFNLEKIINFLILITDNKILDINNKNNEKIFTKAYYIFNLFIKEGELNNINILKEDFIQFFSEEIAFIAYDILLVNYLNNNENNFKNNNNKNNDNNEENNEINEIELLRKIVDIKSTIIDNIVMEYFNDENNNIDLNYINKLFEKNKNFMTLEFFLEKGVDNVKKTTQK